MAIELEGLEFQIQSDANKASDGIDKLVNSLTRLRTAVRGGAGLTSTVNQLNRLNNAISGLDTDNLNELDGVSSNLEKLANAIEKFRNVGNIRLSSAFTNRLSEIVNVSRSIETGDISNLNMLADTLERFRGMQDISIPRVGPTINTPSVTPTVETPNLMTPVDSEIINVTGHTEELQEVMDEATASTNRFGRILTWLRDHLVSTGTEATRTSTGLREVVRVATVLPRMLGSRLASSIKQTTSAFGRFFSSIKRIAMYRLIRSMFSALTKGFTEGMKNLYQYSLIMDTDFAKSMDRLATSALYLKNSMAAMVSPLINALAPAIDLIVDKVVSLLNVINMLIAKLSGKDTYTAARKYGIAWQEAASDVEDAAKTIKRYVLGFDELNILGKHKDDKGSSNNDALDYSSMFEELPIESGIGKFADRLKELVKQGDWSGVGQTIGAKINEAVDKIQWATTGQRIGRGINAAVLTVYSLLDTVNFTNIGSGIATTLNNTLATIDFSFVGRLIVKPFTSLADVIIGVIHTLDFGLVAKSISDTISGAFNEASDWFEKVDWEQFGTDLFNGVKNFITNIDYENIASSFFRLLGNALRAVITTEFFFGINLGNTIRDTIDQADGDNIAEKIAYVIATGFQNIGDFIIQNGIKPFFKALMGDKEWNDFWDTWLDGAETLISGFLEGVDFFKLIADNWFSGDTWNEFWEETGGDIVDGFFTGIANAITDIKKWVKEKIVDPFVKGIKDLFGIASPSKVMMEIGGYVIEGFLNGILNPFKSIGTWVNTNILTPLKNALSKSSLVEFVVGVKNTATEWWSNVTTWWTNIAKSGLNVSAAVSLIKHGWDTVAKWIGSIPIVSQGISLVKSKWETIAKWIGSIPIVSQGISLAKSKWETVSAWIGNLAAKAQPISLSKLKWNTVSAWIGNLAAKAQPISLSKSKWQTVSSWIGGLAVKAQPISLTKSKWNTVSAWIGTLGVKSQPISLIKNNWTSVSTWVGVLTAKSQPISLSKSQWSSVGTWIGTIATKAQPISLTKTGWTSVAGWIGTSPVSVGIKLFGHNFVSLSSWLGTTVNVGVSLFKSGWYSLKSFFGLASGGYNTGHGFSMFKQGGMITDNGEMTKWDKIPKYAGGTTNAHGTMFIAGEAGAEVVGHVNGRTEVLNKSQLGQVMHRSIINGMAQYTSLFKSINAHMTTCANGVINAMLVTTDKIYSGMNNIAIPHDTDILNNMNNIGYNFDDPETADTIADGVRTAMYDTMSRQNDLLREQNELLRGILDKDTTVEVTATSMTKALSRKNQRDGKVVTPVST